MFVAALAGCRTAPASDSAPAARHAELEPTDATLLRFRPTLADRFRTCFTLRTKLNDLRTNMGDTNDATQFDSLSGLVTFDEIVKADEETVELRSWVGALRAAIVATQGTSEPFRREAALAKVIGGDRTRTRSTRNQLLAGYDSRETVEEWPADLWSFSLKTNLFDPLELPEQRLSPGATWPDKRRFGRRSADGKQLDVTTVNQVWRFDSIERGSDGDHWLLSVTGRFEHALTTPVLESKASGKVVGSARVAAANGESGIVRYSVTGSLDVSREFDDADDAWMKAGFDVTMEARTKKLGEGDAFPPRLGGEMADPCANGDRGSVVRRHPLARP